MEQCTLSPHSSGPTPGGESATTIGPASCSTVDNIYDKLIPPGL